MIRTIATVALLAGTAVRLLFVVPSALAADPALEDEIMDVVASADSTDSLQQLVDDAETIQWLANNAESSVSQAVQLEIDRVVTRALSASDQRDAAALVVERSLPNAMQLLDENPGAVGEFLGVSQAALWRDGDPTGTELLADVEELISRLAEPDKSKIIIEGLVIRADHALANRSPQDAVAFLIQAFEAANDDNSRRGIRARLADAWLVAGDAGEAQRYAIDQLNDLIGQGLELGELEGFARAADVLRRAGKADSVRGVLSRLASDLARARGEGRPSDKYLDALWSYLQVSGRSGESPEEAVRSSNLILAALIDDAREDHSRSLGSVRWLEWMIPLAERSAALSEFATAQSLYAELVSNEADRFTATTLDLDLFQRASGVYAADGHIDRFLDLLASAQPNPRAESVSLARFCSTALVRLEMLAAYGRAVEALDELRLCERMYRGASVEEVLDAYDYLVEVAGELSQSDESDDGYAFLSSLRVFWDRPPLVMSDGSRLRFEIDDAYALAEDGGTDEATDALRATFDWARSVDAGPGAFLAIAGAAHDLGADELADTLLRESEELARNRMLVDISPLVGVLRRRSIVQLERGDFAAATADLGRARDLLTVHGWDPYAAAELSVIDARIALETKPTVEAHSLLESAARNPFVLSTERSWVVGLLRDRFGERDSESLNTTIASDSCLTDVCELLREPGPPCLQQSCDRVSQPLLARAWMDKGFELRRIGIESMSTHAFEQAVRHWSSNSGTEQEFARVVEALTQLLPRVRRSDAGEPSTEAGLAALLDSLPEPVRLGMLPLRMGYEIELVLSDQAPGERLASVVRQLTDYVRARGLDGISALLQSGRESLTFDGLPKPLTELRDAVVAAAEEGLGQPGAPVDKTFVDDALDGMEWLTPNQRESITLLLAARVLDALKVSSTDEEFERGLEASTRLAAALLDDSNLIEHAESFIVSAAEAAESRPGAAAAELIALQRERLRVAIEEDMPAPEFTELLGRIQATAQAAPSNREVQREVGRIAPDLGDLLWRRVLQGDAEYAAAILEAIARVQREVRGPDDEAARDTQRYARGLLECSESPVAPATWIRDELAAIDDAELDPLERIDAVTALAADSVRSNELASAVSMLARERLRLEFSPEPMEEAAEMIALELLVIGRTSGLDAQTLAVLNQLLTLIESPKERIFSELYFAFFAARAGATGVARAALNGVDSHLSEPRYANERAWVVDYRRVVELELLLAEGSIERAFEETQTWLRQVTNLETLPWSLEDADYGLRGPFARWDAFLRADERLELSTPLGAMLEILGQASERGLDREATIRAAALVMQWWSASATVLTLAKERVWRTEIADQRRVSRQEAAAQVGMRYFGGQTRIANRAERPLLGAWNNPDPASMRCRFRAGALVEMFDYTREDNLPFSGGVPLTSALSPTGQGPSTASTEQSLAADRQRALVVRPAPLEELLAVPEDVAVMMVATARDKTYQLVVARNGVSFHRMAPTPRELTDNVVAIQQSVQPGEDGALPPFNFSASNQVYHWLFGPNADLLRGKKRLLFSAIGPIERLSINALVVDPPTLGAKARWLDDLFSVVIVPGMASGMLTGVEDIESRVSEPRFLALGHPRLNDDRECASQPLRSPRDLCSVPLAGDLLLDVVAVGNRFHDSAYTCHSTVQASVLVDPVLCLWRDAFTAPNLEQVVFANADAEWDLVLIATHGITAREGESLGLGPTGNGLVLTPEGSDSPWDGVIFATEFLSVPLTTDWVVLAMCNSAAGDNPLSNEAFSGFARSFISAGADAVTVSQWAVDADATTPLVAKMVDERFSNGATPSEGLRRAMRAVRESAGGRLPPEFAHPYYWAGFVSLGR